MSTYQSVTKQGFRSMNSAFSSFCTEEKSQSTSPKRNRRAIKAKRRLYQNMPKNKKIIKEKPDPFLKMTDEQWAHYQTTTMPTRLTRKRKFDVFCAGSDEKMNKILNNAPTYRFI